MTVPPDDAEVAAAQLGRPLRSSVGIAARCPLGLPTVVEVPPVLDDGTPFPTTWYLTCPLATKRIGRLEAAGGVRQLERWADHDPPFGAELAAAHARYATARDARLAPGTSPAPSGGVGGARTGIKCLHAHYADHAAGHPNPVGRVVVPFVEPLDCTEPCFVADADGGVVANPAWREPR
jgi:hypothetical protein